MDSDDFKASRRRHFTLLLHSHSPELAMLTEAADKLAVAQGYLDPLLSDVEAEREQGLFVASLAINYGLKVMEHFGLIDGDTPPMPADLAQAKQAVGKLLAAFREDIHQGRLALGGASEAERGEAKPADFEARSDAEPTAPDVKKLIVDRETFLARYGDKECILGNTKPFQVLDCPSR